MLCIGLGYSATALAAILAPHGTMITATSTSQSGLDRISALGYRAVAFDAAADAIRDATHVVISAPPTANGDPVLLAYHNAIAASPSIRSIAYLSTIGVYGDWNGDWVDETCDLRPASDRSRRRADAERSWLDLGTRSGKQVLVFRLAGIYGPGQSAIDNLRAGTARRIVKPGQVFNRIHVDDIAGIVATAFARSPRHRVYNVADDEPTPPQEVIAYAAELLGLPAPPEIPFADAQLSPMGATFYAENKRASNARAKGDLGWRPLYPSYREGLKAILAHTSNAG